MSKHLLFILAVFSVILCGPVFSQEAGETVIEGVIEKIAEDSSSILVAGTTIITSPEFIDGHYLEVGDKVKITVQEETTGLIAIDCTYVFDDAGFYEHELDESIYEEIPDEEEYGTNLPEG